MREIPNSRQTSLIDSPSSSLATNRRRSSITEHSFHGIDTSPDARRESVTYVSGTFCHLCLGPLTWATLPLPVAGGAEAQDKVTERIDRIFALIMAIGRAMLPRTPTHVGL